MKSGTKKNLDAARKQSHAITWHIGHPVVRYDDGWEIPLKHEDVEQILDSIIPSLSGGPDQY